MRCRCRAFIYIFGYRYMHNWIPCYTTWKHYNHIILILCWYVPRERENIHFKFILFIYTSSLMVWATIDRPSRAKSGFISCTYIVYECHIWIFNFNYTYSYTSLSPMKTQFRLLFTWYHSLCYSIAARRTSGVVLHILINWKKYYSRKID